MIGKYEKAFPQQEIDVTDAEWAEFIDRLNSDDLEVKAKIEELDTLFDYERIDAKYLKRLGEMFAAGIRDTDSDLLKRTKIRYAVQSHKLSGTWKYDWKPLIDTLVGGDSYIYSDGHDNFGKRMRVSKPIPFGLDFSWCGCRAHTTYEPKLGMVRNSGSTGFPFVPFVCLINIDYDTVPLTTSDLYGITIGQNKWSIVGAPDPTYGFIATSEDFFNWTIQNSELATILKSIAYNGSNLWCAGGNDSQIIRSSDLTNWTKVNVLWSPINDIEHNQINLWCIIGNLGRMKTSPDSTNWTSRSSGTGNHLYGLRYDNSFWCAVGNIGTIITSPDAITWTSRTSGVSTALRSVYYNGSNLWCTVGDSGTIITSPDLINWTVQSSGISDNLLSVVYGNGIWCAVGENGTIITSINSVNWFQRDSRTSNDINNIYYNNESFFIVGASGFLASSEDTISWFQVPKTLLDILDYELSLKAPPYMRVYIGTVISGEYITYRILDPWND